MASPVAGTTTGLDGSLGILYTCGEKTCGALVVSESLLGRRVRRIDGGYDRFVVVVDAWELECEQHCDSDEVLEHETVVGGLQQVKIRRVAVGKSHRLALSLDGQIFSWGARDSVLQCGELGQVRTSSSRLRNSSSKSQRSIISPEQEDSDGDRRVACQSAAICQPRPVHTSKELFFRSVACGRCHAAAVTDKGDLYTWGRNYEGQLGHFSISLSKAQNALANGICAWPKFVSTFLSKPRVADVSCGDMFTIVLLESGAIYRFGERFTGVTRRPETKIEAHPHLLTECGDDGARFVGIASGYAHALAVTSSGQLYSWGWNNYGQLGLGASNIIESSATPVPVKAPEVKWSKVFAGGNYSATVSTSGELYTWGNGKHGQLAHGSSHKKCECAPKRVDQLRFAVISAVVCTNRNMYAFAPTHIAGISPQSGEITGGYKLRIKGSGIWASEDLTVRFMPLTEGRLPRGSLGTYDVSTQEVVCLVPKFSLAGEFAVEIAMNGKHFTANGHIFSAFKRPQVTHVSIFETRLSGGEEAVIELDGALPGSCQAPIIRFIPCTVASTLDGDKAEKLHKKRDDMDSVEMVATLTSTTNEDDPKDIQHIFPNADASYRVRFRTPAFESTQELLPCLVEVSYNGLHFVPIEISSPDVDSASSSVHQQQRPHVVWYHDAHVRRVRPNSFLTNALPQTVLIDVDQLLLHCGGVSVIARVDLPQKDGDAAKATVSATLKIQSVRDTNTTISCVVPPLAQWEYAEVPIDEQEPNPTAQTAKSVADWWKRLPRTGFEVDLSVTMNGGKSFLPYKNKTNCGKSQLFALPAVGSLWNVFPPMGVASGNTKLSISGDFFHFDTPDAVVSLQWRDKHFQVPAVCSCFDSEEATPADGKSLNDRRVIFQTPPLPFPGDRETAAAIAEGLVLGSSEEVAVFVSLDGVHFAEKGLKFMYCPTPILLDITPTEAEPGAKMTLKMERLVPSAHASVKLTSAATGVSTVRIGHSCAKQTLLCV